MWPIALLLLALATWGCTPKAKSKDAGDPASDSLPSLDAGDAQTTDASDAATIADDDLPASSSDDLTSRARHLLEAIANDDSDLATDILFPRDAYISSFDTVDPGKQWDTKISLPFKNKVHAAHKHTKGIERAQFVGFELGQPITQALSKKHDLRRSLWRVHHSRITFSIDGKPGHVDIGEMLSWRGAWYVTKLH